jgi:AAA domain/Bifunctional DNA primase/polymerase, N-terminal
MTETAAAELGSVYNEFAPKLAAQGYYPVPIGPGTKAPHRYVPSKKQFKLWAGWHEYPRPIETPQPGAGIGVRTGDGVVAFDYDDEDAALIIAEVFPSSSVNKEGQRGFTPFYRSSRPISSEDWVDANGKVVLQILSRGRQTVIPPTVHPDTGVPYKWTNGRSLYDTRLDELPELPEDYRERLLQLGYVPRKEKRHKEPPLHDGGGYEEMYEGESESPFQEINDLAMRDFAKWVPDLNLYGCRRLRGRYPTYEAVATWRPSNTGRPLEKRKRNLSISGKGISDFGTGRGYSPLDLVMAARECTLSEALDWLSERLKPKGSEIDFDKIIQGPWPGSERVEEPESEGTEESDPGSDPDRPPVPPSSLGEIWHFGDPVPAVLPMLVPGLLPQKGFGYLGGQWGTFKTFVTDDLATAIGSCGRFAGQQVAFQGVVVQIELEGSQGEFRTYAAAAARGVSGQKLPISHLRVSPPTIMIHGRPNPAWGKWARDLATYARALATYHKLPLALISIDPQNTIAGFQDEQSSAEGQVVSNAMWALSRDADCLVLVVDHLGKDPEAGLRGPQLRRPIPSLS